MAEQTRRPRGRPRSEQTLSYESAILDLLAKSRDGLSKADLASALTANPRAIYLVLARLRDRELIVCQFAGYGQYRWRLTSQGRLAKP